MHHIELQIPLIIPGIIYRIAVFILLKYRLLGYGYTFRLIRLANRIYTKVDHEVAQNRREKLIALSRQKYACPQEKIQAELKKYKTVIEPKKPAAEVKKEKAELKQPVSLERPTKKATPDGAELLPDEKGFLAFISQHAGMFVTKVSKALQLSGYKGDRLKSSLIDKDLIVQQETRKALLSRSGSGFAFTLSLWLRTSCIASAPRVLFLKMPLFLGK